MKDLEEVHYILRIKVIWHKNKKHLLSQAIYINKFFVKYVMQDSKKGFLQLKHRVSLS